MDKTIFVTFRISPELKAQLQAVAKAENRSASQQILKYVIEGLKNERK